MKRKAINWSLIYNQIQRIRNVENNDTWILITNSFEEIFLNHLSVTIKKYIKNGLE